MAKLRLTAPPYPADRNFYYAWFSEKAAARFGTAVYEASGGELHVTEVTERPVASSQWEDLEFVGYIRKDTFIGRSSGFFEKDDFEYLDPGPINRGLYQKYGILMANKSLFGTSATPTKERHSESPEPRFSVTEFYMEAGPFVRQQMWAIRTDHGNKFNIDWREEGGGITIEVGKINDKPIVLECFWCNIGAKRVLFYHVSSMMSDKRAALAFISRRCHQAKPWPEPELNRPDRKIGVIVNNDDPIFENVSCAVEANSLEYALIVKREISNYSTWISEAKVFIDLPAVDGRESYAHLSFDRIDGKLICFWDACSEVFDFKKMNDLWSGKKIQTVTNLDNFQICKDIIRS